MKLNIYKILLKNYLYIKIICSGYNILLLVLLNYYIDNSIAGNFLFLMASLNCLAIFSRLGSDNYWIKAETGLIRKTKNEHLLIITISLLASFLFEYFTHQDIYNYFQVFQIFLILTMQNFILISSKIAQTRRNHILSLVLQIIGGNFISTIIFILFNINSISAILISHLLVTILILKYFIINFKTYNVDESFLKRLHYIPQVSMGALNQGLIPIAGEMLGMNKLIAATLLIQRVFSLMTWTSSLFIQRTLQKLSMPNNSKESLNTLLRIYIYSIFKNNTILAIFPLVLIFCYLYFIQPYEISILSITYIFLGTLLSSLVSIMPYIFSIHSKGVVLTFFLIMSIFFSYFIVSLTLNLSSLALFFLLFYLFLFLFTFIYFKFSKFCDV